MREGEQNEGRSFMQLPRLFRLTLEMYLYLFDSHLSPPSSADKNYNPHNALRRRGGYLFVKTSARFIEKPAADFKTSRHYLLQGCCQLCKIARSIAQA